MPRLVPPSAQSTVETALRAGNSRRNAARAANISYSTFYNWLTAGRDDPNGPFGEFHRAILAAEFEFERTLIESMRKQALGEPYHRTRTYVREVQAHAIGPDGKFLFDERGMPVHSTTVVKETSTIEGTRTNPRLALEWLRRRCPEDWGRKSLPSEHDGVIPDGEDVIQVAAPSAPEPPPKVPGIVALGRCLRPTP